MVRTIVQIVSLSLSFLWSFSSCEKETTRLIPPVDSAKKVFIICEGSYGNGNGSLSMYLTEKDSTYLDVYQSINQRTLGDVFQSMQKIGDYYFLCINNSDRIIVLDKDLKHHAVIPVSKPRYILGLGLQKAYVSTLFQNKLRVLNPESLQITGEITLPGLNPEGMLQHLGKVFICTWDTAINRIFVLDPSTDQVINEIPIAGYAPHQMVLDKEQKLWVLAGNMAKGKSATLTRLDPVTGQILRSFQFPIQADVIKPVLNPSADTLYFLEVNFNGGSEHNGVYRMSIHAAALPDLPFIPALPLQYFWALGIHPQNGDIYVGDPRGFVQSGDVLIYQSNGTRKKKFTTGIGPGNFYF